MLFLCTLFVCHIYCVAKHGHFLSVEGRRGITLFSCFHSKSEQQLSLSHISFTTFVPLVDVMEILRVQEPLPPETISPTYNLLPTFESSTYIANNSLHPELLVHQCTYDQRLQQPSLPNAFNPIRSYHQISKMPYHGSIRRRDELVYNEHPYPTHGLPLGPIHRAAQAENIKLRHIPGCHRDGACEAMHERVTRHGLRRVGADMRNLTTRQALRIVRGLPRGEPDRIPTTRELEEAAAPPPPPPPPPQAALPALPAPQPRSSLSGPSSSRQSRHMQPRDINFRHVHPMDIERGGGLVGHPGGGMSRHRGGGMTAMGGHMEMDGHMEMGDFPGGGMPGRGGMGGRGGHMGMGGRRGGHIGDPRMGRPRFYGPPHGGPPYDMGEEYDDRY